MKKALLLILAAAAGLPFISEAQYSGPAVEACRAYALKDLQRHGGSAS
jgi:hypothetical protein